MIFLKDMESRKDNFRRSIKNWQQALEEIEDKIFHLCDLIDDPESLPEDVTNYQSRLEYYRSEKESVLKHIEELKQILNNI
jgi:chromosome segregation ATPase